MKNRQKRDKKKKNEQIHRDLWTVSKGLIYVQLESLRENRKKMVQQRILKKKKE